MTSPDRLVVDASVAIKWVTDEPDSGDAARLLDRQLVAPDLLGIEFANALWKKVRRRELSADEADLAIKSLMRSPVEFVATRPHLDAALSLAVELDHPAYDGVYLAVAEAEGLLLVTADRRFAIRLRRSRFRDRVVILADTTDWDKPA
jgi:predicted nucleic acid-binding protein